MSWLNFNDSLNNIKGQLSNFANNVLAEDKIEIQGAAEEVAESEARREGKTHSNAFRTDDSWQWSTDESKTDQLKTDETITNLKKRIVELENENRDLVANLDQLDHDHQLNTEELVKLKKKLEEELEIVTEKYELLNMKYNKLALAENVYKKKANELKSKYDELTQKNDSSVLNGNDDLSYKYKQLENVRTELEDKVASLVETNTNLEELLRNTNSGIESQLSEMTSKAQLLETENKALRIALQSTKEEKTIENDRIKEYETKIKNLEDELKRNETIDESNCVKLSSETVQSEMKTNDVNHSYEKMIYDLESELKEKENLETEMQKAILECEEVKKNLEEANENNNKIHEQQKDDLKSELSKITEELLKNQGELAESEKSSLKYKSQYEELLVKSKEANSKYLEIIEDYFKEYFDYNTAGTISDGNDTSFLTIFSQRIETISKVIFKLEQKSNSLETKLFELNQTKTDLQNEKNVEIERLIQNSEMLTQELLKRSQEIKDLEEECSQLMKNNDLLINKLTETKETGLQTIYESNEDNVVLFEKQLETANKKIEELEKSLSENNSKLHPYSNVVSETIVEEESNTLNQLKISSEELKECLSKQQKDNECLQKVVEDLQQKLHVAENERDNCRVVIDKMKLDFETTEYQFTEMNINLETLSEEIEKHKMRIDSLVLENQNLKSLQSDNERNDVELKSTKEELSLLVNSNKDLKTVIEELEVKYATDLQNRNQEIEKMQKELEMRSEEINSLQKQIEDISSSSNQIQTDLEKLKSANETFTSFYSELCKILNIDSNNELDKIVEESKVIQHITNMVKQVEKLEKENDNLKSQITEHQNDLLSLQNKEDAQKELQDLMASRNELIAIVQTKHQETLTYHAEIQRLSEILKTETDRNINLEHQIETLKKNLLSTEVLDAKNGEIEKLTDQISFLREKCDVLAKNMLDEQQKVENEKLISLEKEATLSTKLERLQSHLMEVEEHYTQELLQSEQQIALLQARLNEVEQREKDSSTVYTSVSIRANQQNEALHQQLQAMTSQRDEFKKKLMELEDENNVKSAALSNLQLVLEQFQRDKEADVVRETDRIRRQVKQEQKNQDYLRGDIANLEAQLKESKQGLQAALRLTDQLEISKSQISNLKETVTVLTEKLTKKEEELKTVASQTDGKVDKSLVKSLVIGFITSNKNLNKDQLQILKIIATVLDFNEQDHNRVNLNQTHQSNWLGLLLNPAAGDDLPNESLSRAFVNFLEKESKPREIPSLLATNPPSEISTSSRSSSNRTTPTPIVLNEIVLPTFSDFPQHRNSSSILKGVLKDNP